MINHRIKNFVISQNWIVKIINWCFNFFNKKKFLFEVERRKKLSIFNYKELSKPLPYAPTELVIDNNLYGIVYWLKKKWRIKVNKSLDAYIEHGVFFGSLVREDQKKLNVKTIITYGKVREKHLLDANINKEIKKIGPYINYVDSILNKSQYNELKKELGKILLVFPSHSIIGVDSIFDENLFIKEIERIAINFNTVFISLYWTDVLKKDLIKKYEKKGYKIVTSGHRYDLNFLSRQRALIELSDYTMSNNVGTHIGYCIVLNKPHYVFKQEIKKIGKNEKFHKHFNKVRNKKDLISEAQEKEIVYKAFSEFKIGEKINNNQKDIVEKFWGKINKK